MKITSGIKFSDKSRGIGSVESYNPENQKELVQQVYIDPYKEAQDYDNSFDKYYQNLDESNKQQQKNQDSDFTWKDGLDMASDAFRFVADPLMSGIEASIKGVNKLWKSQTGQLIIEKAMDSHIRNRMGDLLKNEGRNIQDIQFLKLYENARQKENELKSEAISGNITDEQKDQLNTISQWLQQNNEEYNKIIVQNKNLQPLYLNLTKQEDQYHKLYRKLGVFDRLKHNLYTGIFPKQSELIADLYDINNLQFNEQAQSEDRTPIINKLDTLLQDNFDKAKIKQQSIKENQDNFRNGNWFYRPELIDPKYREKVDNNQFAFTDPSTWLEAVPQVGTSIGELSATVGSAGLGALTRTTAKFLGKRGIPYAGVVLAIGEASLNIANTAYQRQSETNVEVFTNYTQKVMKLAENRKIDLRSVLAQCTEQLNSKGILTDNMDVQDIIENALVYNVTTDDEAFEQVKRDSFAGLSDLEKQNNALGLWDLAEIGVYSYGGHLAFNSLKSGIGRYASNAVRQNKTTGKIITGLEKGAKAIDSQINRGIYNIAKHNPIKAQTTRNTLDLLANYTSKLGFTMLSEATEEGQQYVTQDTYLQDEGNRMQSGINYLSAFAKNFGYGYEAWAGALGLHPSKTLNNNNELSQSMKIGGFIGMLLGGGASTINTFHQGYEMVQNDALLREMAAYDIANKETDVKVDRWYKAARMGKIPEVISEIQSIKERFNPEGLTDENINEDIKQANYVNFIYNNENVQSNLNDLGIRKGSEEHKTFVKNAIKAYNDESKLRNSLQTALTDLSSKISDIYTGEIYQKHVDALFNVLFYTGEENDTASEAEKGQFVEYLKQASLIKIEYDALVKLSSELKDLEEFAKKANENGYNMSMQDLNQLRKSVEERKKVLYADKKTLKQQGIVMPYLQNQDQLEQLFVNVNLLRIMHDKAKNRSQAYLMGYVLPSDQRAEFDFGFKTWSSLTQQEKDEIIENDKVQAREEGREPKSQPKLIYDYNLEQRQKQGIDNEESLRPRNYANKIIQQDLEEYTASARTYEELPEDVQQEELSQAEQPTEEPDFTPTEAPDGVIVPVGGPAAPVSSPTTEQESTSETDMYEEQEDDAVEFGEGDFTSADAIDDIDQVEPEPEAFVPEDLQGGEGETTEKSSRKKKRETEVPSFSNQQEEESNEPQNDHFEAQLEFNEQDYTTEDAAEDYDESTDPEDALPIGATIKIENGEQKAIEENNEPVVPNPEEIERPVTRKEDGQINASDFVEDQDGNVRYNGDIVTPEQLQIEQQTEQFLSQGKTPAEALNDAARSGTKIDGIQTSATIRGAWKVGKTLFYKPDAVKPMKLPADLPGVTTIHTGKELGEALGQPDFLKNKTCYFVVGKYGDTTFDPNKPETYSEAAVYLVIQKGDEAYVMAYKNYKDAYESYSHIYGDELSKALKDPDAPVSENAKRAALDLKVLQQEKQRIVSQYLSRVPKQKGKYKLPSTALTHVRPTQINITNGIFNNQKEGRNPIFTPLSKCKTFNIPNDPKQILKSVQFGYGTGSGINTETPFVIKDIQTGEALYWKGGYSGRLYLVPTVESTPSGRYTAPIMISEKFFRTPGINSPSDIVLRNRRDPNDTYHCFAEYIYDLIVNGDPDKLLPLIINQGERTRLARRLEDRLQFLSKKQIGYDPDTNKFYIATKNSSRGDGYYRTEISLEQIETNPDLKKQILFNIMQYYHWNTDKNVMSSPLSEKLRDLAIELDLDKLVFYPGELEFTLEDLGISRKDGKLVKDEVAPPAIAWMIRTGKLMTDMGEYAFRDGFIYVENTTVDEQDQSQIAPVEKEESKPEIKEKQQDQNLDSQNEQITPKETPQQRAARVMNSLGKPDNNAPKNTRFLTKEEIEEFCSARGLKPNMDFSVYFYNDEGNAMMVPKVAYQKAVGNNSVLGEYYSTVENEKNGTFVDVESAKKWLISKLGLTRDQLLIVDPVMRMTTNGPEVLGVTRLSVDRLGKLFGQIIISKQGREGIQFHEAWHYINLLMHSERERFILYDEYRKQHREANNLSDNEIEELLAEDFRKWALIENNKGIRYKVLKTFRRIKDFVKSMFGISDNLLNNVYRNINKGRYAQYKLNDSSVQEFKQTYSNKGVYFSIPGVSEDRSKSMPHITNPDIFYNVVDSLMGTVFGNFNIRSEADLAQLTQGMSYLKDIIQGNKDWGLIDENNQELVQEVLDNFDLFQSAIIDEMSQLNIKAVQTEGNGKQETDTGEKDPTENWDKVSYEFSKKLNTSFNAKLFFYSIPKMEYDEQKNLVPVTDSIFNMNMTEPFDVVWNKLLSRLWDVETWDDILRRSREYAKADPFFGAFLQYVTGNNAPDSNTETQILTTIKSAKNELITAEFQQAIQETKARKQEVEGLSINADRKSTDSKQIVGSWRLISSEELGLRKKYPREWGQLFYLSGMVNKSNPALFFVDEAKLELQKSKVDDIATYIKAIADDLRSGKSELTESQIHKIATDAKQDLVDVLNDMGIGVDMLSIDFLLYGLNKPKFNFPTIGQFDKLYTLFTDTSKLKLNTSLFGNLTKLVEGETDKLKLNNPFIVKPDNFIEQLSIAHGKSHPNPTEFSITGPDGKILYPITQNNYMSDRIRWFNNDIAEVNEALKPKYNNHSLLLRSVQNGNKLKLHTFVATYNKNEGSSRDYFGISSVEDYLAKMLFTHEDKITLPTMADKKTWYAIEGVKLFHQMLSNKVTTKQMVNGVLKDVVTEDNMYHFSDETLDVFVNYLSDEIESILEYYKRVPDVIENPTLAVDNYHGKIKDGKMDPNGNGGYFRYFSSIKVKDDQGNYKYMPLNRIIYNWAKFDYENGTNNMVTRLNQLKSYLLADKKFARDAINATLQDKVSQEIKYLTKKKIIKYENGKLSNLLIPTNIIDDYKKSLSKEKASKVNRRRTENSRNAAASEDILYSIIANHVANTIISIEEVEKAFVGDPAFYKWKRNKKDPSIIVERSVDKIKRLGSVLSTGDNLRTFWGNGDPRNETKFTVLHMEDNMVKSNQFDVLSKKFLATEVLKYLQRTGKYTQDQLLNMISDSNINKTIKTISPKVMQSLRDSVARQVAAYGEDDRGRGNINSSDAAVFIRPALYKKIVQSIGEWSPAVEKAFDIMESDQDWLSDPAAYQEALETLIKPLKMIYFGNHYNSLLKINIPVFDKMAIFPMFKVLAKGDNYHIYQRMNNDELGAIDMITFESAVKVGGRRKFKPYKDNLNNTFNLRDLLKPSTATVQNGVSREGFDADNTKLATYIQDIRNLRLQMNTDPHEHSDRSLGTQFAKTAMSNLEKTRTYGKNKGKAFTGRQIINNIYSSINKLSDFGASRIMNSFFDVDEYGNATLNEQKLSNFLIEQGRSSGLSRDVIASFQIDPITGRIRVPISAQSNRRFVESRLISTVGKEAIDINTPGGSAIQMPFFGFKDTTNVQRQENIGRAFNDGKELNPINKDGSMDCMLSLNFFRHIVPKKVMKQGYTAARDWLIEKKIVGPDSNPCALGYRIPTQGLSSTASLKVTDVLPATMGDTIIVPNDFTAMTGSDFDIDKLYIALGYYDEDGNYLNCDWDNFENNDEKQVVNGLLDMYRIAISDDSNIDQTKAPLDNLTNKLKDTILKTVMGTSSGEAAPFYELLPSYQAFKKFEYTGGKKGIGPFALASTNHALTQSVNLHMHFDGLEEYNLGNISDIVGQDGERILDWLSAMINAHVDVAKDPYIINLNVNSVTYNMTAFLLRTGKGEDTFYFLAQPILKEFTSLAIEQAGEYGVTETEYDNQILAKVVEQYKNKATQLAKSETNPKKKASMLKVLEKLGTPESSVNQQQALNKDKLIKSLNKYQKYLQNNEDPTMLDFNYYIQQLIVAKAYQDLSVPAQRLSTLINISQVDTKKYGNSLTQILNYSLQINDYVSKNDEMFYVTNDQGDIVENESALAHYFGDTFLSKKMSYALNIPRQILRNQMITATDQYASVYEFLVNNLYGSTRGSLSRDKALQADKIIDNYFRSRVMDMVDELQLDNGELYNMVSGKLSVPKSLYNFKKVLRNNEDGKYSAFVDPAGNIVNGLINYLIPRLSNSLNTNPIDSILTFNSSSQNSSNYENRLIAYFSDLIDSPDEKVRKFANRLLKYALYTSLDNKGANSFFHLVPVDYKIKIGYVDQISQAIDQMNDVQNQSFMTSDSEMDTPSVGNYPSIAISLARNNVNNEDLVRTVPSPISNKYNSAGFIRSEDYTYNEQATWHYKAFTLNASNARKDFITVKKNFYGKTQSILYVRAGTVKVFDTRNNKRVGAADQIVYVAVPTLGYGSIKEYYKASNELSDFEENNIETMTAAEVIDFYSDHNKFRLSTKNIPFNEIGIEFVPSVYLHDNFNNFNNKQVNGYETAIPDSKHEETQNVQKEQQAVEQSGLLKKNNIMSKVNNMLNTSVSKSEEFITDFNLTESDINEEAADMNPNAMRWCNTD